MWKWSENESCSVVSDSLRPHGLYKPWNSPGQDIRVDSHSLLQGIFPTQRSNPGLPHYRWILSQLSHKGSPRILEWVVYPFSRASSRPRNQTGVSCMYAGGFFTNWATMSHVYSSAAVSKNLTTIDLYACVESPQALTFFQPWMGEESWGLISFGGIFPM